MPTYSYRPLFTASAPGDYPNREALIAAADTLARHSLQRDWLIHSEHIPAGYTYFGQFIDHDLSLMDRGTGDPGPGLPTPYPPVNGRSPALDLDSLYGSGFDDATLGFRHQAGRFAIGTTASGAPMDLPRANPASGHRVALIVDARNDENLLVAQFQLLLMKHHNRVVDHYAATGMDASRCFDLARAETIRVCQHLCLYDFLRRLVPNGIFNDVLAGRVPSLCAHYALPDDCLPLEFATSIFRLHGMVRKQYTFGTGPDLTINELFLLTGRNPDFAALEDRHVVDWRRFFFVDHSRKGLNHAMRISPFVGFVAFENITMIRRTLLRGQQLRIASAQDVHACLLRDFPAEVQTRFGIRAPESAYIRQTFGSSSALARHTPLWLYLMLEAFEQQQGHRLGKLGGWLLTDILLHTVRKAAINIFDGTWSPATSIINTVGSGAAPKAQLSMPDLVQFINP